VSEPENDCTPYGTDSNGSLDSLDAGTNVRYRRGIDTPFAPRNIYSLLVQKLSELPVFGLKFNRPQILLPILFD
jgi:hypothetical protein